MQMAPPRRAKVRTNWYSYIAAFTLSLFSVTMILKQLFGCFFCAHSYFHHPILTTRGQRRSISVLYHWLESDRLGLDMLISSTIDPAQFSLIIGWQLVLALDSYSNLQLPPAALHCLFFAKLVLIHVVAQSVSPWQESQLLRLKLFSQLRPCNLIQKRDIMKKVIYLGSIMIIMYKVGIGYIHPYFKRAINPTSNDPEPYFSDKAHTPTQTINLTHKDIWFVLQLVKNICVLNRIALSRLLLFLPFSGWCTLISSPFQHKHELKDTQKHA